MEEPSLLDYLKAKLTPWRGKAPEIPPAEAVASPEAIAQEQALPAEPATSITKTSAIEKTAAWPWRSALALVLALMGQLSLEPAPERAWTTGAFFYLAAVGMLLLAYRRSEWALPAHSLPATQAAPARVQVRSGYLLISLPLLLAAFLAMGGNRFTGLNVTLWVLGSLLFVWAFWQPGVATMPWWRRCWVFLKQRCWQVTISPWTLLLLAAFGLVIFFRLYRLAAVPPEMVSDHAEKLLDIWDVLHGETRIFFPRNTGREALQMYLTAAIIRTLGTGYSFISLKIGTALAGLLTLPFIYLLGKEMGNQRAGLLAMVMAGIAYWPNVISRVGLRFPLYPLFVAPTLFFLARGLRRAQINDFILAGLFLGIGLHGYTPIRILPFVVIAAVGLYLLHPQSRGLRRQAILGLVLAGMVSLVIFLPLLRFALENPELFSYRSFTRLGSVEQPLPGPAWQIFLGNLWRALTMFAWDDGEIWVHSVTHRPALDVISAGCFYLGALLVLLRYLRQRDWSDLFWLLSVPLLMLPSILSLAFPAENPALNRMGGAIVPVFLIIGLTMDSFMKALSERIRSPWGVRVAWGAIALLVALAGGQNFDLVFRQYQSYYQMASWNTTEMGKLIRNFADSIGSPDTAHVVAYPYWVDTRLVGINAGYPTRDYAIQVDQLAPPAAEATSPMEKRARLFLLNPQDTPSLESLRRLYPRGVTRIYPSTLEGHSFIIFFVPPEP